MPTYNVTPTPSHASRWRSPASCRRRRRPIDYTNLNGGTHTPRTYPHILFQKIIIFNFFGPFPRAPGAQEPHFRIPPISNCIISQRPSIRGYIDSRQKQVISKNSGISKMVNYKLQNEASFIEFENQHSLIVLKIYSFYDIYLYDGRNISLYQFLQLLHCKIRLSNKRLCKMQPNESQRTAHNGKTSVKLSVLL